MNRTGLRLLAVTTWVLATACSSINATAPAHASATDPVIRLEEMGGFAYHAHAWTMGPPQRQWHGVGVWGHQLRRRDDRRGAVAGARA